MNNGPSEQIPEQLSHLLSLFDSLAKQVDTVNKRVTNMEHSARPIDPQLPIPLQSEHFDT